MKKRKLWNTLLPLFVSTALCVTSRLGILHATLVYAPIGHLQYHWLTAPALQSHSPSRTARESPRTDIIFNTCLLDLLTCELPLVLSVLINWIINNAALSVVPLCVFFYIHRATCFTHKGAAADATLAYPHKHLYTTTWTFICTYELWTFIQSLVTNSTMVCTLLLWRHCSFFSLASLVDLLTFISLLGSCHLQWECSGSGLLVQVIIYVAVGHWVDVFRDLQWIWTMWLMNE